MKPAASVMFATLLAMMLQFPRPGTGMDSRRMEDQSWLSGQVVTQDSKPIPLAMVRVQPRSDAARADQHNGVSEWPGAEARVRRDGSFRISVPGGMMYEVCATVPTKPKQCRTVDVQTNDLETMVFSF